MKLSRYIGVVRLLMSAVYMIRIIHRNLQSKCFSKFVNMNKDMNRTYIEYYEFDNNVVLILIAIGAYKSTL